MSPAIKIEHMSVNLGNHSILCDITLTVKQGSITGLLGPSGAGKTTLLRSIVGRQKIHSGAITIFNQPTGVASLRSDIGYVTQAPSVYLDLTIEENLHYFATLVGVARDRVKQVVDEVGLSAQRRQLVATLSGGQISRVSLAVALLARPKLLVLDEPTVGVDPLLRRELWQQFHRLADDGATLIVSSHVMEEASKCNHLLLMREGRILAQGNPEELYKRTGTHDLETVFLRLIGETS